MSDQEDLVSLPRLIGARRMTWAGIAAIVTIAAVVVGGISWLVQLGDSVHQLSEDVAALQLTVGQTTAGMRQDFRDGISALQQQLQQRSDTSDRQLDRVAGRVESIDNALRQLLIQQRAAAGDTQHPSPQVAVGPPLSPGMRGQD